MVYVMMAGLAVRGVLGLRITPPNNPEANIHYACLLPDYWGLPGCP